MFLLSECPMQFTHVIQEPGPELSAGVSMISSRKGRVPHSGLVNLELKII